MNTRERAIHLAAAAGRFPFLGAVTAADLLTLVRAELGHAEALDDFQPYGAHLAQAMPPACILHVISSNTPAAGLQSLIRGLLLGSHNFCKVPGTGLPEIAEFRTALPATLAARVEIAAELPETWLAQAEAVIVFGRDETIRHFQARMRPGQIFIAHGHKLSLGVIFEDAEFVSVTGAARDVSLFDQQGCLSPQVFFVRDTARTYAQKLAEAMNCFNTAQPRSPVSLSESNAIRVRREEIRFRAANGEPFTLWESADSTDWTVVFDATPEFPGSPLNRFVFVKPLPDDFAALLAEVRPHLSACGYWPATLANARILASLGPSRLCPVGQMQVPPFTWHQDGQQVLAPLVRWIDAETAD
jgi:hypothetical protein